MTIKPATRTGVKALVGFFGRSGSGKTMSALLFARGLVGPAGRIVMIDTETGRGSLFADIIPGGYSVIDLEPPFSPERYAEAIEEAEKAADCIVVDSMSHEWSGEGGVLDLQEAEFERMGSRDAAKLASWIKPKIAHKRMVGRLLRARCALICCLRGEERTKVIKDEAGRTKVVTDDFSTPLFDSRFIFEMLLSIETLNVGGQGGFTRVWKCTHPHIASLLPRPGEQVTVAHGEALARWCAVPTGAAPSPAVTPAAAPSADPLKPLRMELWTLCEAFRGPARTWDIAESQLRAWKILPEGAKLTALAKADLLEVIDKVRIQINQA